MKILIISDSHGNIANLKHVMGFARKIKAGAVIHCGDWNSLDAVNAVVNFNIPIYSVLGNADIDPKTEKLLNRMCKKFDQKYLEVEIEGKRIGIIHDLKDFKHKDISLDILFTGHIHRQKEEIEMGLRVVNPGALENGINFAIYETKTGKIEFIME